MLLGGMFHSMSMHQRYTGKAEQPGKASAILAIGEPQRGASVQSKASTLHAAHKEISWTNNQVYLHLPFLHQHR